jgi:hypothetical protein
MADDPEPPLHVSADDARQGEIILRKRWQRIVFLAGLVVIVVVALVLRILALR